MQDDILGDQPVSSEPAAAPAGQAPVNDFDGSQFQYTFRGAPVTPASKEELIEKLQLGHSYQENRTKFEQQQQEFQRQKQTYDKYAQLDKQLQQSPEFKEKLWNLHNEFSQPKQTQGAQVDPHVAELQQQFQQIQQAQADKDLQSEMDSLKKSHPDHAWGKDTGEGTPEKQLMQFMYENGISNPEHAYRAFYFPTIAQKAKFEGASQASKQAVAANKQGYVSTGPATGKKAPVKNPANYAEALNAMLAERQL